jgi:hypothetical protein|tara:strand:+ start:83 stop:457 length:375 start_codon:yes stop_codon:yes gene_type:complete
LCPTQAAAEISHWDVMVRISYENIEESYNDVKKSVCGRKACSVMILVASEVDAMASARMLTQQLRSDNIAYTLRPVSNRHHLVLNRDSFITEDINTIFMINCGAVSLAWFDLQRETFTDETTVD